MESFVVLGHHISTMDAFILLCTVGYGAYSICTGMRLKRKQRLFRNSLVIPYGKKEEDCMDTPQYIQAITPKLLSFGTLLLISGVFSFMWPILIEETALPYLLGLISIVPVLIILIVFNFLLKKTYHVFWP